MPIKISLPQTPRASIQSRNADGSLSVLISGLPTNTVKKTSSSTNVTIETIETILRVFEGGLTGFAVFCSMQIV